MSGTEEKFKEHCEFACVQLGGHVAFGGHFARARAPSLFIRRAQKFVPLVSQTKHKAPLERTGESGTRFGPIPSDFKQHHGRRKQRQQLAPVARFPFGQTLDSCRRFLVDSTSSLSLSLPLSPSSSSIGNWPPPGMASDSCEPLASKPTGF